MSDTNLANRMLSSCQAKLFCCRSISFHLSNLLQLHQYTLRQETIGCGLCGAAVDGSVLKPEAQLLDPARRGFGAFS